MPEHAETHQLAAKRQTHVSPAPPRPLTLFLFPVQLRALQVLAENVSAIRDEIIATLQGRLAFARIVLRLELVAHFFGVDTRATQIDDDGVERWVHNFRSVTKSGEVPRHYVDESVYEKMPPAKQGLRVRA